MFIGVFNELAKTGIVFRGGVLMLTITLYLCVYWIVLADIVKVTI